MSAIADLLKGVAAVSALALSLGFASAPAFAETKNTTNWNASSFGKACNAATHCAGGPHSNGQGYQGVITNGNQTTNVNCSSSSCTYTTSGGGGGGGSPARTAPKDKTLGTGVGLGGLLAGQSPNTSAKPSVPKTGPKVDTVYAPSMNPPKVETVKPAKVEPPKLTTVPVDKGVKVNIAK